jgi:hypothetical protein
MMTSVLYGFADQPNGLPAFAELVSQYLFAASIAVWVQRDVIRRQQSVPYDFDSFIFVFWPFATPVYLFRTRGWCALVPIAAFIGVAVAVLVFEGALLSSRMSSV